MKLIHRVELPTKSAVLVLGTTSTGALALCLELWHPGTPDTDPHPSRVEWGPLEALYGAVERLLDFDGEDLLCLFSEAPTELLDQLAVALGYELA
jgi:hypothetical protein